MKKIILVFVLFIFSLGVKAQDNSQVFYEYRYDWLKYNEKKGKRSYPAVISIIGNKIIIAHKHGLYYLDLIKHTHKEGEDTYTYDYYGLEGFLIVGRFGAKWISPWGELIVFGMSEERIKQLLRE